MICAHFGGLLLFNINALLLKIYLQIQFKQNKVYLYIQF
jgi:hypothetical protein